MYVRMSNAAMKYMSFKSSSLTLLYKHEDLQDLGRTRVLQTWVDI
jgi:hypothetical protein